jgi:5-formyltetrahydrofolate cyclo-ligase
VSAEAKARLRQPLLAARQTLSAETLAGVRAAVREAVLAECRARGWRCVAGYVPLRTEPGSLELLDELRSGGVRVLVPVLVQNHDLDWAQWTPAGQGDVPRLGSVRGLGSVLGLGAIGDADAVLVPALAVARDGTRLGRGGGSYDRALRRARPGTPVVALLHAGEFVESLPSEPWDVPVTAVVTPAGWRDLGWMA